MTLLALETADTTCSVAVWHDGQCRAEAHIHRARVHAARLMPLMQETLAHAAIEPCDVEGVAVSAGPGSYTGLRIGMSTAKGFAMARGLPIVQVPTLTAATHALAPWTAPGDLVIAALDARRNDVFAAVHARTDEGWTETAAAAPYHVDALVADVLHSHEDETVWVTAPGADKVAHALEDRKMQIRCVSTEHRRLSAQHIAALGATLLAEGLTADPQTVEPTYLKAFQGTPTAKTV